jgi:16S rRNA (adenine(1408)-N(1))-methyltransferase
LAARFERVVVDLGTGDGRYVLARAAAEPRALVLGLDANAAGMVEAASRAARRGPPNARFAVAAAERLPPELGGLIDEVRVHFPWGSLLRGLLGAAGQPSILAGLAGLLRPGAETTALLSVTPHDRSAGLPALEDTLGPELDRRYAREGLRLLDWRPATRDEVAASHSTWAKRLAAGDARPVWLLRAARGRSGCRRSRRDEVGRCRQ